MKKRIILATMCIILVLAGNELIAQEKGFSTKKLGNIIFVDVPDYMTKTFGLNDIAKVQYANSEKEAYTIIIEEDKDDIKTAGGSFENSQDYYNYFIKNFGIDSIAVLSESPAKSGKLNAYQAQISGHIDNLDLFYLVTIVESPTHFYNIISWTVAENKNQLINDFKRIASSLKE
jgi:hypothetical protein